MNAGSTLVLAGCAAAGLLVGSTLRTGAARTDAAREDRPAAAAPGAPFVQVIDGVRITLLDAHEGVTFRGETLRRGLSPAQSEAFDRPGPHPNPYVSVTMLVEPLDPARAPSIELSNPSWGWPLDVDADGSRSTPVLSYAFSSATLIPGQTEPCASDVVRVPELKERSDRRTVTIIGRRPPPGPARFSVDLRRDGVTLGTVVFDDVPLR